MKKNLASFFLVTLLFALVGCAGGTTATATETATFEKEESGTTIRLVYTYQGDKILSQTSEVTYPYSMFGVTTKEEAETLVGSTLDTSAYEGVTGLTHSIEYTDTDVVEKSTFDFENINVDEVNALPGMTLEYDPTTGASMKTTEEALISAGYTKVE